VTKLVRHAATSLLLAVLVLPACGKNNPAEPPPTPTASASAEATPPAPAASSSASAEPGAQPAIREALGTIAKIEVMKLDEALQRTKLFTISKPKEVEEVLKAINVDQTPGGHLRRCPDQLVLVMQDESGTAKGEVGLCDVDTLGPEFTPTGGGRKAIQIADEETFRKDLKLPKSAPKK
jgi:hypothetical protein